MRQRKERRRIFGKRVREKKLNVHTHNSHKDSANILCIPQKSTLLSCTSTTLQLHDSCNSWVASTWLNALIVIQSLCNKCNVSAVSPLFFDVIRQLTLSSLDK